MNERIAIIDGIRTPFCKAGGVLKNLEADDLGAFTVKELMARTGFPPEEVDELIFGNVLQPPHATNIARVLAVKGGLPIEVPAFTVNRNCASGLEAITSGANQIRLGQSDVVIAGGTESMSKFPILFSDEMRDFLQKVKRAKTWGQRFKLLLKFRFSLFYPQIPEIADPVCELSMGQTAENLARDFVVTREEQDEYALSSQNRAWSATKEGRFAEEIIPIPIAPNYDHIQEFDDGVREGQTMEQLQKLRPVFDRYTGTVTAGNSSQVTDGAVALLLMKESKAKEMGIKPLGYIRDYASAALDPSRMGLGPIFSTSKLLKRSGMQMSDFDLIEINEAFAAQIVALEKAFTSNQFAKEKLGRDKALGELNRDRLNVNGGAVALGHPLGSSGARLTLTILKELNRRKKNLGLVTLCVGGGQGEAAVLEVE